MANSPESASPTDAAPDPAAATTQAVSGDVSGAPAARQVPASDPPGKLKQLLNKIRGRDPLEVGISRIKPNSRAGRELAMRQLQDGYMEAVETMKSVREHLERQSDRGDKMLDMMQGVPEALKAIPEAAKNQERMLSHISDNLERQNETATHLTNAIVSLAGASEKQGETLSGINARMAEEDVSRKQLNAGVANLNDTLGGVQEESTATRESMHRLNEESRLNDLRMQEMYQKSNRMTMLMMVLVLALVIGALAMIGGLVYVLLNPDLLRAPADAAAEAVTVLVAGPPLPAGR